MMADRPDPFSKWSRTLAPLFWLIYAVANLVRRSDIPFNVLLALLNSALFFYILREKTVPS